MVAASLLKDLGFLVEFTPCHKLRKIVGMAPADCSALLEIPLETVGGLDRVFEIFESFLELDPGAVSTVVSTYCWFALAWRAAFSSMR